MVKPLILQNIVRYHCKNLRGSIKGNEMTQSITLGLVVETVEYATYLRNQEGTQTGCCRNQKLHGLGMCRNVLSCQWLISPLGTNGASLSCKKHWIEAQLFLELRQILCKITLVKGMTEHRKS